MRRAGLLLAAAAALTFFLSPFAWQLLTSLRPEGDLFTRTWPRALTWENYLALARDPLFGRVVLNSLLVACATTLGCLAIGSGAAFALAMLEFRGRRLLLGAALAVSMFPPIATVSPLYLIIRALGLRDRLAGLVLPYTTFALPLTLWFLTRFFQQLPPELYRAARVDGCTPFQAFYRVVLPISGPGLATTGLLVFISSWNELLYALTFTSSPGRRTVPVAISLFAGEHVEPWAEIAAASVAATLPLALLTLAFQRRLVAGLTAGAVKE